MTSAQIIDALGGTRVVAQATGEPFLTVTKWRQVGRRIPPRHWATLARLDQAAAAGVTLEVLTALPEPREAATEAA